MAPGARQAKMKPLKKIRGRVFADIYSYVARIVGRNHFDITGIKRAGDANHSRESKRHDQISPVKLKRLSVSRRLANLAVDGQPAVAGGNVHRVTISNAAFQQRRRERVLQLVLNQSP